MLSVILSTWTLFFGLLLISAGNGLQLVLLGTGANDAGFGRIVTGFVMSGYFIGIFIGSFLVPLILAKVGHIRVFGAMAALASASVLVHSILLDPFIWICMRLASGFCFAGMFIVCESWLNEKATNKTRGQLLSLYMITNMLGMGLGQMMIGFSNNETSTLFIIASVIVSIAVVPILITATPVPDFEAPERLSLHRLFQVSPLAVVGMSLVGVTIAMIFGMGAFYARSIGLNNFQIGYFMSSLTIGTLILQYPVGRLSDKFDRRLVILGTSIVAGLSILSAVFFNTQQFIYLLISMAIFGGLCFALLSLMIAHANDFLAPNQMVAMSSGLLMVNSGGAIIGPPLIATVTEFVGVASFFPTMSLFLFAISGFVIYRMRIRDAVPEDSQGTFVAIPESSLGVAVTLNPEVEWVENTINKTENNPNLNKHFTN